MVSPVADSYTEFFVGYKLSYVVDDVKYNVYRRPTPGKGNVLYIYSTGSYELDFDISDELRPIGEFDGTIPNHVYMSTDNIMWDFGDGHQARGLNVRHTYTTPGEYTVLVTLRDYDGRPKISRYRQIIHVADFVKGEVKWETPNMKSLRCDTTPAGAPSHNLTIKTSTPSRYIQASESQNQLWSEDPTHTVSLHVSGSNSQPAAADDYELYKYAQFDRLWRFVGTDDLTPLNHIEIKPSTVYMRPYLVEVSDGVWDTHYSYYIDPDILPADITDDVVKTYANENEYYTNVYESISTRNTNIDLSYTIAGHVGRENVRYLDDTCKIYLSRQQDPVFLFANLQISDAFMSQPVVNLESEPLFSIEDWNVDVLPIKVMYNPATALSITPTGAQGITFPPNKYQNTKIALNIALVDDQRASILKSDPYPELKFEAIHRPEWGYWEYPSPVSYFAPMWELLAAGGGDESLDIDRGVNPTIPVTTYGCANLYILPEEETGTYQLSASCIIKDVPYANKEVESYYITNMHTDRIFTIRPGYLDKVYTFEPEYTISVRDHITRVYAQLEEPVKVIAEVSTDPLTHYFCIGVTSQASAWIADSDLDALIHISRFGEHLDTIILPQDLGVTDFETNIQSPVTHPGIGQTLTEADNAYSIAGVSINGDDDIWVATADQPVLLKYDALQPGQSERKAPLEVQVTIDGYDPNRLQPQKIETDRHNNIWVIVLYSNALPSSSYINSSQGLSANDHPDDSFILLKYSDTGELLIDPVVFPSNVELHDLLVDGFNDIWVTNITPGEHGSVFHISSTGEILNEMKTFEDPITGEIQSFSKPAQLIMDMDDNLWVAHNGNELLRFETDTRGSTTTYQCTLLTTAGPKWEENLAAVEIQGRRHAIEGLSCDSDNRILVINNVSKKLYMFDAIDESRHTWDPFAVEDFTEGRNYNEAPIPLESDKDYHLPNSYHVLQAFGDWTGIRWIQKYFKQPNTTRIVTGVSNTFNIVDSIPNVHKINENHGYSDTIESMTLQPTIGNSSNFIDRVIQPAAGGINEQPETIGKTIYEKISNFAINVVDIDTANVTQFYSLCNQLGFEIKDLNYLSPASIKRLIDMFSISYNKLVGSRDYTETAFDALGQIPSIDLGKNLGDKLDFTFHTITAGVPIIAKELFNNNFRLIKPMTIRGETSTDHVSVYPLSGYNEDWGWRLSFPIGEPVNHYYDFYSFIPNVSRYSQHISNLPTAETSAEINLESPYGSSDHMQLEGIIDWGNRMTTLPETITTLESTYNPTNDSHVGVPTSSVIESLLEKKLRQGLGIDPPDLPWMEEPEIQRVNPPSPIPYDDPDS